MYSSYVCDFEKSSGSARNVNTVYFYTIVICIGMYVGCRFSYIVGFMCSVTLKQATVTAVIHHGVISTNGVVVSS